MFLSCGASSSVTISQQQNVSLLNENAPRTFLSIIFALRHTITVNSNPSILNGIVKDG
jgi:hypothetical protein